MTRRERYQRIIDYFTNHMPGAETELVYGNSYELLVAVILSAQCTDKRVNLVTPAFFAAFPDTETLALARQEDVYPYIRSISYPNNKAKNLVAMARRVRDNFNGDIPSKVDELVTLPGVGRKTANVIASVIFNQPAMAVDTHVFRVSARIGLTVNAKTPLAAEQQLVKYFPVHLISKAHHWLILHGRYICQARKPKCHQCGVRDACKYYNTVLKKTRKRDSKVIPVL
jgi:endonuclease III